eukprot:GFUD01016846.1.p1 GENE.GFUD01016846.1~~GFUD01016846.1.p1  ORF type:complete len:518 (+),score=83.19 GFUD01016846.1:208-1761(+)
MPSPTKLSGLEIRIEDESDEKYELESELNTENKECDVSPGQSGKDFVSEENFKEVKIFLLNEEGKTFNVINTVMDELEYAVDDECFPKEKNIDKCDTDDPYACDECGFSTFQKLSLDIHKRDRHSGDSVVCEVCGEGFSGLRNLRVHREKSHGGVLYQCSECKYTATSSRYVKGHYKYKHAAKNYFCDFCDYKHSVLNIVAFHVAEKHGIKSIQCDLCSYTCATQRGLNRHKLKKHKKQTKRFKCDHCEYEAGQTSDIKRHAQARHENVKYSCDQCSYVGPTKRSLGRHMNTKHMGVSLDCEECEFSAQSNQQLRYHTSERHWKKEELLNCDQCEYVCIAKWRLTRHAETMHSSKTFNCDQCDYKAESKRKLKVHKDSAHTVFTCFICQKEEKTRYLMESHFAVTHKINPKDADPTAAVEPPACDQCAFIGKTKRSLLYHKKKGCSFSSPKLAQLLNQCESERKDTRVRKKSHLNSKKPRPVKQENSLKKDPVISSRSEEVELEFALDHIVTTDENI